MKSSKLTIILILILVFSLSCKNTKEAEIKTVEAGTVEQTIAKTETEIQNYAAASLTIKGMTCEMGCAKTIEKKLANLDGVGSAKVDFENELATVTFDVTKISAEDLKNAVSAAGSKYSVEGLEILKK